MYQGKTLRVQALPDQFVELTFDREGDSINKIDQLTIDELRQAVAAITASSSVRGVLITSAKNVFIAGADITEFGDTFKLPVQELAAFMSARPNEIFVALEDLPIPTVTAINGFALGGGLELALCTAFRVMSTTAQAGLPEVTLGIFPGFGGTVRLPRVANAQVAIDWIAGGKPNSADAALKAGVADKVVAPEALRDTALDLLRDASAGKVDWRARQERKRVALPLGSDERSALFAAAKAKVQASSPKHQPAALAAVEAMERTAAMDRAEALKEEGLAFAHIAKTQAAASLVQIFLNGQQLKKLFKKHATNARPVRRGAVLGAGIMGGGISYTSALHGIPVRLKDIAQPQLDLGTGEARKLLNKAVKTGRMTQEKADATLASIVPQLDYANFDDADVVIEAVVESIKVKHAVLTDLEDRVRQDAVIASNTSSLRIDDIGQPLKRPENFVGMHFFNPVPVMQLVEIIKGSKTSDQAVSTAVGYAVAMGKTPIVVKDCQGFLVNRVLTAYMRGFLELVNEGADFVKADQVMEAFGWPMGPAYLEDVIGIDTGTHVSDIISAGYADRMPRLEKDALRLMAQNKRYGRKNGIGFYRYETDPDGKPKRSVAEDSHALLATLQANGRRDFSDQEIIERMMLPLILEAAIALEEGVVGSPAELDMALLLGISLPAYLGGALKYADWLGLDHVVKRLDAYSHLGPMYHPTERMRQMAAAGQTFY